MKMSKWLWNILFGIGLAPMMIVGDGDGGSGDGDGGDNGGGTGDGDGDGDGGSGDGDGGSGDGNGDGGKKLSDTEAKLLKETMERKKQLKKAQEEKDALAAKLKEFEGIDPAAVRSLLAEKQAREAEELEKKGQWDALKKQMADQHAVEKTELNTKLSEKDARLAALEAKVADLTVGSAFAQSAFIKDELSLTPSKTRVVYGAHFEYNDEGKVVGYDKPKGAADRVVLVDASGEALSFDAALRKLVEADPDRDQLLRSKMKAGAGSKTNAKGAPANTSTEGLTGKNRIAAALAKGGAIK